MTPTLSSINPAEEAAKACLAKVYSAIDANRNFRLEAGAGAGKTYTLIKSILYLIKRRGDEYLKRNKKIACITYTNVAKEEINRRTDNHPLVQADTIHAFSWNIIKTYQKKLRELVSAFSSEIWMEKFKESGDIGNRTITYDLGYRKITDTEVLLHHDDIMVLMTSFLLDKKFITVLKSRYPVIFIDEYQDTNKDLANAIVKNIIEIDGAPLIGLFGDHWQKIYGSSACGLISSSKLEEIGKNANFRSEKHIVECLNRIRPELPQHFCDPESLGEVSIYHTNSWVGDRRTEPHWVDDLPEADAHDYLEILKGRLSTNGWIFSNVDNVKNTKILMLTNNVLATEQGYSNVAETFNFTDDFLKKSDDYLAFLVDFVEPCIQLFLKKKYGEMFAVLNQRTPKILKHGDKISWNTDMNKLVSARDTSTIGEVIQILATTNRPKLPSKIEEKERRFHEILGLEESNRSDEQKKEFEKLSKIRAIPYKEILALSEYINNNSIYSTKHGVKGEEYDNVLVVLGRGWNHYNWNQMLEWMNTTVPAKKIDTFERNRNLFYVAVSRPKKRLALLFTQKLSQSALQSVEKLFATNISSL